MPPIGSSPARKAGTVESEHTPTSDETETLELGRRLLRDPEIRARVERALADARSFDPKEPGVTAEELPEFLREHGF